MQASKRDWHGIHQTWSYHPRAFRWSGEMICGINFLPVATEMRAWMLQQGKLSLLPDKQAPEKGGFTNPFTNSGITLSLLMSQVINSSYDFTETVNPNHDGVCSEIERVRLFNEILLYSARVCEVTIKQLLYCTQIPQKMYNRMALGQLLESNCPTCRRSNGKEHHTVSMIGSLAHPYHLCLEFEHCAMDHMDFINKMRNSEAAHSNVQELNIKSSEASKAQLKKESTDVLSDFLHMLSHIEKLEQSMLLDLANKGEAINKLKDDGLEAKDCNFDLVPGKEFVFQAPK